MARDTPEGRDGTLRGVRKEIMTRPLNAPARTFARLGIAFGIAMEVLSFGSAAQAAHGGTDHAAKAAASPESKISPFLYRAIGAANAMDMLVVFAPPPDLSEASSLTDPGERRRFVYDTLRRTAAASQQPLVSWLEQRGASPTQFWIVNAVLVKGDLGLAWEVASRPEVARVESNPLVRGLDAFDLVQPGDVPTDVRSEEAGADSLAESSISTTRAAATSAPEAVTWGVAAVHAPEVWSLEGVRGEGIVVASCDTGVEWTHPSIKAKYRGWDGAAADHGYSWHDSIDHTTAPLDDNNHGTHTTGTMVGDDCNGSTIGVAPAARWIACRNMDHGDGTPARYLECMQWALAPYPEGSDPMSAGRPDLGADITNNSWGCPASEGCSPLTLESAFEALRAAGQMTVVAAGNSGTACGTVSDPPAIYDEVFSAGALTQLSPTYRIASYSSRGPVTVDGSNRMKPNVAAPGSSVLSSVKGGVCSSFSGTSMASPHTAGTMALLWAAKPNLRRHIAISRCYLEQSAGPVIINNTPPSCGGTTQADRPNNYWGWGAINAQAAITLGPDGDGDGIADACDCDPASAGSFDAPVSVANDRFDSARRLVWDSQALVVGPAVHYDVARGLVSQLMIDGDFRSASCRANDVVSTLFSDPDLPSAGDAFYYLVRGQNVCGTGIYGYDSSGSLRVVPSDCP